MKITLLKETFEDRMQLSARFTSTRVSTVQSIQGILLEASEGSLAFTSTNLTDFCYTTVSADVSVKGSCVCEVKKTLEFLNLLQPGDITVELDDTTLIISQGRTKGHFNVYDAADFPEIPHLAGKDFKLSESIIKKLPLVLFSASKDETRPVMTGVYISSAKDSSVFVTTDGFRLSLLQDKLPDSFPNVIIPASIFTEASRLSKGKGVDMIISPEDRLIKFSIGSVDLYSRVIEGEFPPYEKVIPQDSTTSMIIPVEDLIKNIRLVAIFAREQADVIIFDVSEEGLMIKPKAHTKKESHVFQQLVGFEGEPMKIAFNYKYVLEFLNTISSENVLIELTQPTAPGAFKSGEDTDYVHVIMPLRTEETTE